MLERLLDWLLPLVAVAACVFLFNLVWEQIKEGRLTGAVMVGREPLDASGSLQEGTLTNEGMQLPPAGTPRGSHYHYYSRLCGPEPAVDTHRSIYTLRDEAGTLNLSDRPPENADFRETAIALDWAEGSFKLNLSVHGSAINRLPISFESRLRSDAYAIIRSLAHLSGQKKLVPVRVSLAVYGTEEEYQRATRFAKTGSSGVYSTSSGNAAMFLQNSEQATLSVARHEITHALNCNLFGAIPPWLNEGLAEYFEAWKYGMQWASSGPRPSRSRSRECRQGVAVRVFSPCCTVTMMPSGMPAGRITRCPRA